MSSVNPTSSGSNYWQTIKEGWNGAVNEVEEDAEAFGKVIGSAYDSVESAVSSAASSVSNAASEGAQLAKDAWETVGNAIDTYV
jgi:phage-related protein